MRRAHKWLLTLAATGLCLGAWLVAHARAPAGAHGPPTGAPLVTSNPGPVAASPPPVSRVGGDAIVAAGIPGGARGAAARFVRAYRWWDTGRRDSTLARALRATSTRALWSQLRSRAARPPATIINPPRLGRLVFLRAQGRVRVVSLTRAGERYVTLELARRHAHWLISAVGI